MGTHPKDDRPPSAEALVRAYRQEADRQKLLVRKAQLTENRLLFVVSALRKLFGDENFVTLLRAEGLDSLPAYLAAENPRKRKGLNMAKQVSMGFDPNGLIVPIANILPLKQLRPSLKAHAKISTGACIRARSGNH